MDILPLPAGRPAGPEPLTAEEMARYVVAAAAWAPSGAGSYPQLVLRFGTVIQTAVRVRRPPASVLFERGGEHLSISHG